MRILALGVLAAGVAAAAAIASQGAQTGPSSSESPYVLRSEPGVVTKSILTVGDSVNLKPDGTPYRMVGIPDGLGAFDNGNGTFTLLMNHELGNTQGIVRAHGARGSFVSKWTIEKSSLRVLHGEDQIEDLWVWNGSTWQVSSNDGSPTRLNRLLSRPGAGLGLLQRGDRQRLRRPALPERGGRRNSGAAVRPRRRHRPELRAHAVARQLLVRERRRAP
jgi:hypothetical protein